MVFVQRLFILQENKVVLFAEEINVEIELYEDSKGETILDVIQDNTIVEMTEEQSGENKEYSLIRYIFEVETDDQEIIEQVIEGYVHNDRIVLINNADQYRTERLETEEEIEIESETIDSEDKQEQLRLH